MRGTKSVKQRRENLESLLGISLGNIGSFTLDEEIASLRNCENMIGVAQVPVGTAGPVKVNSKKLFIPLATTEGALVASVNRGCKAISLSGGAKVYVEKIGVTRGPVFKTEGLEESVRFVRWLKAHTNELIHWSEKTSSHLKLLKFEPVIIGSYVFVRFYFDTDRAMGMNMATIATDAIAGLIEKKTGVKCLSVSGNFCVDKKASWQNFILGRGIKINAEVILKKKVLREVLKTSSKRFFDVWLAKCMVGSAVSGSIGFNAQFANVVAAVFLATGQDLAHVVEGSLGITTTQPVGENLKMGVYLPDVLIGAVGGGTGLATQKEAMSIIGEENLAEAVGGAVLAGEISLLASLAEGSLANAHKRLGRGKEYK